MNTIRTIAVIGAMQPEIELLKGRLNNRESQHFGAFEIHCGELHGKRIVLTLSGIGKVNAAAATATAILKFSPDCVINTGSAGGLAQGLKVGDVVIGSETAHHDVDVTAFGYAIGQVPQLPPAFASDHALVTAAERAAVAFPNAAVRRGLISSFTAVRPLPPSAKTSPMCRRWRWKLPPSRKPAPNSTCRLSLSAPYPMRPTRRRISALRSSCKPPPSIRRKWWTG